MRLSGLLLLAFCAGCAPPPSEEPIRCAVVGGLLDAGLWKAVSERFERDTGRKIQVVAHGPKEGLVRDFLAENADLIVLHACDAVINLVADGDAVDAQPWVRNDLVIVGPPGDPAGLRGMTDAVEAVRKLFRSEAPFVVHSSIGAQEVLRSLLEEGEASLPAGTTVLLESRAQKVLQVAMEKKAYTLVGRIPFLNGRMPNPGLEILVQGDPRLRRPYLAAAASPRRVGAARHAAARRLVEYLRSSRTQAWLETQPLFFPVKAADAP